MFLVPRTRILIRILPAMYPQLLRCSISHTPAIEKKQILHKKREYLQASDDPDTFGTLSVNLKEGERDPDDIAEENYIEREPFHSQKLGIRQYADMIKEHLKNGRVFEAIDVIETRMIKEDRVKPTNYIMNIAINGCAKVGYTKKAFSLYNRMKERDLKVTGATYTSLFNASAMSPFTKDALQRAHHLREIMAEKGYVPNITNYNAMIKAFGRLGDIKTAFKLVDEMQTQRLAVRTDTFNFLLQACASDKEEGFRHALLVWQKMHTRRLTPDLYSFNLMLRIARDCGVGDVQETQVLLDQIMSDTKHRRAAILAKRQKQIEMVQIGSKVENQEGSEVVKVTVARPEPSVMPNLLSVAPYVGNLIAISDVIQPEHRLVLLGGVTGFFAEMKEYKVTPDAKTCTQLLEIIPSTIAAEKLLLKLMKEENIKCDIDFFNILIKKRAMRMDFDEARRVLRMIKTANLHADIVTYGVLAISCRTMEQAQIFLSEMTEKGIQPNIEIFGAMFRQGTGTMNFNYALDILDLIKQNNIKPSETLLKNIYRFRSYLNLITRQTEYSEEEKKFREDVKLFKARLNEWLDEMGIRGLTLEDAIKKYQIHPYKQFKEPAQTGFEAEKNTRRRHWNKKKGKLMNIE